MLSIRDLKDTELLVVVREKDSTAIVDTEFFPTTAVFPDVYLYTDRPLYKSGANVRFKGVLRQPVNGLSRLWNSLTGKTEVARVSLVDLTGGVVVKEVDAPLTAFGTFSGALAIPPGADLNGVYRVRAQLAGAREEAALATAPAAPALAERGVEAVVVLAAGDAAVIVDFLFLHEVTQRGRIRAHGFAPGDGGWPSGGLAPSPWTTRADPVKTRLSLGVISAADDAAGGARESRSRRVPRRRRRSRATRARLSVA